MTIPKNDPKLGRYFGSTELIIAWLGRWFLVQTFLEEKQGDGEIERDIQKVRQLIDEDESSESVTC